MPQFSDSTDLHTDAYAVNTPASTPPVAGLNINQKKALGISAAALLLGGTAWAIAKKPDETAQSTDQVEEPAAGPTEGNTGGTAGETTEAATTSLPSDIDVAGKVTDNMSFEEAFAAARDEVGMGGVFGWHGHWYNTFEKEEWASLSLDQRQEYTEMITGEELPVKVYHSPVSDNTAAPQPASQPTAIEGHLNGQRVIGLDYNHDGVIDVLVIDSADGHIYRVVDATGDDGLDTVYQYDSLGGELTAVSRLEQPVLLSNDQFSQGLEESMSEAVVGSIVEPEAPTIESPDVTDENTDVTDESTIDDDTDSSDDKEYDHHPAASPETDDNTYVNNGDVHDMD